MKSTSISDAKNRLSALVKAVQGGESITITDRGVPVARLVPVRLGKGVPARVVQLAQEGLARLPEQSPTARWLDMPLPRLTRGPGPVEVLLAERAEGR